MPDALCQERDNRRKKAVIYRRKRARTVPIEYDDPKMQEAFEHAYIDYEHLLTVE